MAGKNNVNNSDLIDRGERRPDSKGLVLALELMELGVELARQRIARENPGMSRRDIVAKTNEWLSARRINTGVNKPK